MTEVETQRHQLEHTFKEINGETHLHPTPVEDRQKFYEDKVGRWVQSMCGTQDSCHI